MTKSALFKEVAKGDYSTKLVDGFKTKIVKLDRERLDVVLVSLHGRGTQFYLTEKLKT